jgi:bacterioferritin
MKNGSTSSKILGLLNQAVARELQVCIQYMLQHAMGASQGLEGFTQSSSDKQAIFVASHSPFFLPGATLKKIAITEMRHAEAISERIVLLGGEPTTQPARITMDKTIKAMLENDLEQERSAIDLYKTIITLAGNENDGFTAALFKKILSDEENHHRTFSTLLR